MYQLPDFWMFPDILQTRSAKYQTTKPKQTHRPHPRHVSSRPPSPPPKARSRQANIKQAKKNEVDESNLVRKAEHPVLGFISSVFAKNKSYCLTVGDNNKKVLFVEITEKKCAQHKAVLSELVKVSCKRSFSKEQALAWRDRKIGEA